MMRWVALASLVAAATTGCNDVQCGPGTFANGNDCVGYDPNDKTAPVLTVSPPGGRTRDPLPSIVMLTTDEPATIIYTVDGTDPDPAAVGEPSPVTIVGVSQGETIKLIAIDAAGNRSSIQNETYDSDNVAPAPVSGLTITLNGTLPHVTWTPPTDSDYAGVVLARVVDVIDVAPPAGQMVAAGAALSPSVEVVSAGTATSFDDSTRPPGPFRYVAWAYDDLGNYSNGRAAQASIPLGSFTAQLTYDTAAATLAIPTAPANLDLTGTTATLAGTTLTVNLQIANKTTQYFQNPKIEILATTNATFSAPDGTADGHPFKTLGPNLFAPGTTKNVTLVYTGVTAGSIVTMDVTFAQHPSMTALLRTNQQTLVDLGAGTISPNFATSSRGPNDRLGGRVRPGVLVGGRYLDLPTTHGSIERFDLVSRAKAGSVSLGSGDRTNVQWLISTRGELLAMLKVAGKRRTGLIELVRLDESLHELGRVKLPYNDDRGFTRPAISPDGNTLAIPVVGGILLLDVATLTPIDAVPSTPIVDLIPTGFTDRVHALTFFNGTDGIFAIGRLNGQAAIIKKTTSGYTKTAYQDTATTARGYSAVLAPDGRVWFVFGIASGVRVYDPTTDAVSTITYAPQSQGVAVVEGQLWAIRQDKVNLDQISTTGAVQRTVTIPAVTGVTMGAYGHTLDSLR